MKNVINYYYNLYPNSIYQVKGGYYFFINKVRYFFVKYNNEFNDIKKVYDLQLDLLSKNIYVHPIILNKQNQIMTLVSGEYYILLMTVYYNNAIGLKNIVSFSSLQVNNNFNDWGKLWADKNDYLEYQINMLGRNYLILRDSFSYFLGMGELAIQLFNSLERTVCPLTLSHRRIRFTDTFYEFYNPFNVLFDYRVRDIAEYLKSKFFSGFSIENDLIYYFNNIRLSSYEYMLFLIRMIYPTYYFDMFEEVINNKADEDKVCDIIKKISEYENIIKKIYQYFRSFLFIPTIEWFEL